jgi:hypothetical protein
VSDNEDDVNIIDEEEDERDVSGGEGKVRKVDFK